MSLDDFRRDIEGAQTLTPYSLKWPEENFQPIHSVTLGKTVSSWLRDQSIQSGAIDPWTLWASEDGHLLSAFSAQPQDFSELTRHGDVTKEDTHWVFRSARPLLSAWTGFDQQLPPETPDLKLNAVMRRASPGTPLHQTLGAALVEGQDLVLQRLLEHYVSDLSDLPPLRGCFRTQELLFLHFEVPIPDQLDTPVPEFADLQYRFGDLLYDWEIHASPYGGAVSLLASVHARFLNSWRWHSLKA